MTEPSGLPFRVGTWRGTGWTEARGGRVAFEQREVVRSPLDGELITIEGRANVPGRPDDVRFRAFAVAMAGPDGVTWRAYSGGHVVEVPLHVDGPRYRWELPGAPGVTVRYEGVVAGGTWRQRGWRTDGGGTGWVPAFGMELHPHP